MNVLVIAEHRQVRLVVEFGSRALMQWMERLTNDPKELP